MESETLAGEAKAKVDSAKNRVARLWSMKTTEQDNEAYRKEFAHEKPIIDSELNEAERLATNARKKYNRNSGAWLQLARALYYKPDHKQARTILKDALALFPNDADLKDLQDFNNAKLNSVPEVIFRKASIMHSPKRYRNLLLLMGLGVLATVALVAAEDPARGSCRSGAARQPQEAYDCPCNAPCQEVHGAVYQGPSQAGTRTMQPFASGATVRWPRCRLDSPDRDRPWS